MRILQPVLLLEEAVRHVHTPQQAGGGVVGGELASFIPSVDPVKVLQLCCLLLCVGCLLPACIQSLPLCLLYQIRPSCILILDPHHQETGPRLVHAQAHPIIRHLQQLFVLHPGHLPSLGGSFPISSSTSSTSILIIDRSALANVRVDNHSFLIPSFYLGFYRKCIIF